MTVKPTKLSSKQKGEITENRAAEMITLGSSGYLSCFRPFSDDDGLDIVINPKGQFKPLFLQVKSRFKLQKNNSFIQNVGLKTFSPNKHFYILFMLFNDKTLEVDALWLVPSLDFKKKAYHKKAGKSYKDFYRFRANPKSTKNVWSPYMIDKTRLYEELNGIINFLYKKELK